MYRTTDLYDVHGENLQIAEPIFSDFGGCRVFGGPIATVRVCEDNVLVKQRLSEPGKGRVLVVDGRGSRWCALLGDRVATLALNNGWAGIVIHGCVRDVVELAEIDVGIKALAAMPRKSRKIGAGEVAVEVTFAGVTFRPGAWLYADEDGMVIAESECPEPPRG